MRDACVGFEDQAYFVEEDPGNYNAPHAFSITLKDKHRVPQLQAALDKADIAWKRNFGAMPTQHDCFAYLGHKLGEFPNAEYIGDNGIHIGVHKLLTADDLGRITDTVVKFFTT
jgi:dTDP-4-amino-4,6-dideoxygalactose transaminase